MATGKKQQGFSSRTRFSLVITLVAIVLPLIFFSGAFGALKINLSLFSNPDLEDGLVGHWTFDGKDMVDNVTDRSGQGNNGLLQNFTSTTTRPGRIGQGLLFDGVDDRVAIGDVGSAQSIAFWMQSSSSTQDILRLGGEAAVGWYDSNYSFCRKLTMTAGGTAGGVATTTTNGFALIATSTLSDLRHVDHGGNIQLLNNAGTPTATPRDVVVTSGTDCSTDGGSKIDFYFEDYASTTGSFVLHLEATDISSTTAKTVLMYYGNASAADQSNEAGVFGALGETGVWNLHEDPSTAGTNGIRDSTSGNNHATPEGSMTSSDLVEGRIGDGIDFDGTDDALSDGTSTTLNFPNTVSAWVYPRASGKFISKEIGSSFVWNLLLNQWIGNSDRELWLQRGFWSGGLMCRVNGAAPLNEWTHITVTWDFAGGTAEGDCSTQVRMYVDGVEASISSDTQSGVNSSDPDSATFTMGAGSSSNFDGILDEVRMHNRVIHPMDVLTQYNMMANNAAFWTIGSAEERVVSPHITLQGGSIVTGDLSNPTIYVDGTVSSTVGSDWHHVVVVNSALVSAADVTLGNVSSFYDGILDDVRVYDRALSAEDVERLYGLGATTRINRTITTNPDLEDGLVGHWTFDGKDMVDNVADRSGQGNNGILENFTSTTTKPGRIGQALEFDGSDDRTSHGSVFNTSTEDFSVSVWVKTDVGYVDQGSSSNGILAKGLGSPYWGIYFNSNNQPYFSINNVSNAGISTAINDGQWHHLVGIRSGDTLIIYLDTVRGTDGATTGTVGSGSFYIGGDGSTARYFNGTIDDVRVYNRALSEDEVERIYGLGATTRINRTITTNPDLEDGLVGHWTFDGKDMVDNVADRSGQGNNGILENFTSTTTRPGRIGQALEFDDIDDHVSGASTEIQSLTQATVAMWVYKETTGNNAYFSTMEFDGGGNGPFNKGFQFNRNGWTYTEHTRLVVDCGTGSQDIHVRSDSTVPTGEWTFIAFTWSGGCAASDVTFYINDSEESATVLSGTDGTGTYIPGDDGFTIGRAATGGGAFFDGKIDDVRVYDRALSSDEMKRLYELGS